MQNILDHAIMNGELEPLIVVTPLSTAETARPKTFIRNSGKMSIPFVESKYSTYAESTTPQGIALQECTEVSADSQWRIDNMVCNG